MSRPINIVVAIGYDGCPDPDAFCKEVINEIENVDGKIAARVSGESTSVQWGEEMATWIAAEIPSHRLLGMGVGLRAVAKKYNQESIAITHGSLILL
jgi:hypothetical protein